MIDITEHTACRFSIFAKFSNGKSEYEIDFYLIEIQLVLISFVKLSQVMHSKQLTMNTLKYYQ